MIFKVSSNPNHSMILQKHLVESNKTTPCRETKSRKKLLPSLTSATKQQLPEFSIGYLLLSSFLSSVLKKAMELVTVLPSMMNSPVLVQNLHGGKLSQLLQLHTWQFVA